MRCSAVALLAWVALPLGAQKILPPVKDSAAVVYDDEGLRIHSTDGRRQLRFRGYVAMDGRLVLSDTSDAAPNTIALRRARVIVDANVNPWIAFRLSLDLLTPGVPPTVDAFADVTVNSHWWVRAGKQKTPYGWERYNAIGDQFFPERSIANSLTSSRDGGLLVTGEYGGGRYEGSVGVFNGIPDGAIAHEDVNDAKDAVLRLIVRPVVRERGQGFLFGFNGTAGAQRGTVSAPQLPRFATPAGPVWFSYRESAGALADGSRRRAGVFSAVHFGAWGGTAEWYNNSARIRRGSSFGDIGTTGWLALADVVLTGEPSVHNGIVPAHRFEPARGNWGAVQAVARVSRVSIDRAAFPNFADSTLSARSATESAMGLNWYITRTTKAMLDWEHTAFVGGAVSGSRKAEDYLVLRAQVAF